MLRGKKSIWNSVCCRVIFESEEENVKTFSKKNKGWDLLSCLQDMSKKSKEVLE